MKGDTGVSCHMLRLNQPSVAHPRYAMRVPRCGVPRVMRLFTRASPPSRFT
ncbi:hypothetical protein COSO111634_27780 [Corallococcus soli]